MVMALPVPTLALLKLAVELMVRRSPATRLSVKLTGAVVVASYTLVVPLPALTTKSR